MKSHFIKYEIFCNNCRNLYPHPLYTYLHTDIELDDLTQDELRELFIKHEGKPDFYCDDCGNQDYWRILLVDDTANPKIDNQFIISLYDTPKGIKTTIEKGSKSYTRLEMLLSLNTIENDVVDLIRDYKNRGINTFVKDLSTKNSSAFILVDLEKDTFNLNTRILELKNMNYNTILDAIGFLRSQFL